MHIRSYLIAGFIGLLAVTSASANSCSNVDIHGSFDHSGLRVNEFGISIAGTWRIMGEQDESKQPMFNLTSIDCARQSDSPSSLQCKYMSAVVWANSEAPNANQPNCSLDLDWSDYPMKEVQKGVFVGLGSSGLCFSTQLTIDVGKNNAFLSFNRSKEADDIDKQKPGTCGAPPRTRALMNCTPYAEMRQKIRTPGTRYCDFKSAGDK